MHVVQFFKTNKLKCFQIHATLWFYNKILNGIKLQLNASKGSDEITPLTNVAWLQILEATP